MPFLAGSCPILRSSLRGTTRTPVELHHAVFIDRRKVREEARASHGLASKIDGLVEPYCDSRNQGEEGGEGDEGCRNMEEVRMQP